MPDLPFDLRQSEREREREEEELKEDRGEGEKNGNGGEKAEFRLFRKLIIRPPNSFLEYFQFLSLSLSLTRSRELDESFFLFHAFEFHCKGGGRGYKNISLRLEKSYRRILCALYLINRTNSSFHSLPFFEMTQFWTQPGSKNRTGRCFDTEFCSVIFLGRLVS